MRSVQVEIGLNVFKLLIISLKTIAKVTRLFERKTLRRHLEDSNFSLLQRINATVVTFPLTVRPNLKQTFKICRKETKRKKKSVSGMVPFSSGTANKLGRAAVRRWQVADRKTKGADTFG